MALLDNGRSQSLVLSKFDAVVGTTIVGTTIVSVETLP